LGGWFCSCEYVQKTQKREKAILKKFGKAGGMGGEPDGLGGRKTRRRILLGG